MLHSFKNGENYYLYDVEGGSFFQIDRLIYKIVSNQSLEDYTTSEIKEGKKDLENLEKQGLILGEKQNLANYVRDEVKALCLHICHDCNLRCDYCFASDGTYNTEKDYMSLEVGKAAIDFLIEKSKNVKNLEVDFFGGEPLLNFEVVKDIVSYSKAQGEKHGKVFSFTMTTNCVLLSEDKVEFLNREMSNIVLSLDGRKGVHDSVRKTANGKGSYDVAVKNALRLKEVRGEKDYYARGTFTQNNLDFYEDVMHLRNLGFDQISVEPVVLDPSSPFAIKESDLPLVYEQYDKLTRKYIELRKDGSTWMNFFHFMLDLENGPCMGKRVRGCGAGVGYLAVTPTGDIFPCHQFAALPQFKMGDVFTKTLNEEIRNAFKNSTLLSKKECENCWGKYHCGGGCAANNFNFGGSIDTPYSLACDLFKKRLECSMAVYSEEREDKENVEKSTKNQEN